MSKNGLTVFSRVNSGKFWDFPWDFGVLKMPIQLDMKNLSHEFVERKSMTWGKPTGLVFSAFFSHKKQVLIPTIHQPFTNHHATHAMPINHLDGKASTLLPLTTSLVLALPLGVIAMATGILVRAWNGKILGGFGTGTGKWNGGLDVFAFLGHVLGFLGSCFGFYCTKW